MSLINQLNAESIQFLIYLTTKTIIFLVCLYALVFDRMARCFTAKLSVSILMIASLACISFSVNNSNLININAEVLFNISAALLALRCLWIKIVKRPIKKLYYKRKNDDKICNHSRT